MSSMSENTQNHSPRWPVVLTDIFLYLHAQTHIKTFIYLSHLKSEKKAELNELSELEYSKTLS